MKKILPLLVLAFITGNAFAQIKRTPARQRTDTAIQVAPQNETTNNRRQLLRELNLTPEQQIKMKALRDQHKDAKDAIENDSTLSDLQRSGKLKALKKQQVAKIQEILTEEQKIKFRELRLKNKKND